MRRVVITGLGMVSPLGLDVESSWKNAVAGNSGIDLIKSMDTSPFEVKIAGEVKNFDASGFLGPKEVKRTTRFIQLAVVTAGETLADSGVLKHLAPEKIGCIIGVGIGSMQSTSDACDGLRAKGQKGVSPFYIPLMIPNMAAGLVANQFILKGPNLCPTTACTSGTHAIGEAWNLIRLGYADAILCGGSEAAICDLSLSGFGNMKALSKNNSQPQKASRPFDKNRDGFVLGEGAGLMVLETLESAQKRNAKIYAEMIGFGLSADAYHMTSPPPDGEGAARCMESAIASANINFDEVDYINAHGTSTPINDVVETNAILSVFKDHAYNLAISSTKGVTGHCLGAAGGIEGVFLAKTLYHQIAPPTATLEEQDPDCPLDYIPKTARSFAINVGLSNSFGFGGTNGSIVMKKFT